jgi:hypothetical protein
VARKHLGWYLSQQPGSQQPGSQQPGSQQPGGEDAASAASRSAAFRARLVRAGSAALQMRLVTDYFDGRPLPDGCLAHGTTEELAA